MERFEGKDDDVVDEIHAQDSPGWPEKPEGAVDDVSTASSAERDPGDADGQIWADGAEDQEEDETGVAAESPEGDAKLEGDGVDVPVTATEVPELGMDLEAYTHSFSEKYGDRVEDVSARIQTADMQGDGRYGADYDDEEGRGASAGSPDDPSAARWSFGRRANDLGGASPITPQRAPYGGSAADLRNVQDELDAAGSANASLSGPRMAAAAADQLPAFASEQSKALDEEIRRREARLESLCAKLADDDNRVRAMREHLANVRQELQHTNALVEAKRGAATTEEHMTALATREAGRYAQEAKRLAAAAEAARDELNALQDGIFRSGEAMDRFKLQMNWNQEELEQWALAAKQKDDDAAALQRYRAADDAKAKDLTLQIEKLSQAIVNNKVAMEALDAEGAAKQVEMDRTADEFRELHAERQELVKKWEEAVDTMRRRDAEVVAVGERYAAARAHRQQRRDLLHQHGQRLRLQQEENEELRGRTEALERIVQKRRQEASEAAEALERARDDLDALKGTLSSSAHALGAKRAAAAAASRQIEKQQAQLEAARRRLAAARRRLAEEAGRTETAEEQARHAEEEAREREAEVRAAGKVLAAHKEDMFKASQRLAALRRDEAALIAEIAGAAAALRNIKGTIRGLDKEQARQQELLYTAEFQIQQMERKVARGLGERTEEEKAELLAAIAALEAEAATAREAKRQLAAQARQLDNELKAAARRKETSEKQHLQLKDTITELELECSAAEVTLQRSTARKESDMVAADVARLEVRRLQDVLNGRADQVFSLENRRQQLAMSMAERRAEIAVYVEVQRAALKAAEEERHRATLELGQRRQAVDKLRTKHEALVKASRVEGGGDHSQAFFVIAAAQRREELQREGDELDATICGAERELRALANTLQHLQARNIGLRLAHQRADPSAPEVEEARRLEARAAAAVDAAFRHRRELRRFDADAEEAAARLEGLRASAEAAADDCERTAAAVATAEAEAARQKEGLRRAHEKLSKARLTCRAATAGEDGGSSGAGAAAAAAEGIDEGRDPLEGGALEARDRERGAGETPTDKMLRADCLRETSASVLYALGQLCREFPELHAELMPALKAAGLTVPKHPPVQGGGGGGGGGGALLGLGGLRGLVDPSAAAAAGGGGGESNNDGSSRGSREGGSRPSSVRSGASGVSSRSSVSRRTGTGSGGGGGRGRQPAALKQVELKL